jgi:hypothetical protein
VLQGVQTEAPVELMNEPTPQAPQAVAPKADE